MMDNYTLPRPGVPYIPKHNSFIPLFLALCLFFQWGCKNKSGITEIDVAPVVRSTTPANNASDVAVNSAISAAFSDNMNPATISGSTFTLHNDTVAITGTVTYADSMATFVPASILSYNSNYTATISSDVESLTGTGMERNHEWSFSTIAEPVVTDTEPPQAVSTNPPSNAEGVSVNTTVSVTFNEPMNETTINNSSFSVSQDDNLVDGTVSYAGGTASFDPANPLPFGATFTATIASSVEDTAGNALANDLSWSFTTEANPDNTAPEVTTTEPADNQEDVAPNTVITATFNEPMDPASINGSTFTLQQGSIGITGTITYSGNSASFTPSGNLQFGTLYTATVTGAAQDLAGNSLPGDVSWSFTTGSEPDETAPEVTATDPEPDELDVAVNSNITATFSEPLDGATVNNSTFTVTQGETPIAGSVSYSGVTAIFNPTNNLPFGSILEATITGSVQDLAGNSLPADISWNFTTVQETTPPVIVSTFPDQNAEDIAVGTTISVTFNEPMDPTSITTATFTVSEDDDDEQITGTVTYSENTATFTPSAPLSFDATYTASVTTEVQDIAGNNLQDNFTWSFSTAEEPDNTAPDVSSTSPADNQADVSVATNITVTFSEPMNSATIDNTSFSVSQDGSPVDGSISYSGTTATFNPNNNLAFGGPVTATVTTGVTDLAGNALGSDFFWSFSTEQESTPPEITGTSPANNATNISAGTVITATFSEAMDAATIDEESFTLSLGGTLVAGSVSYATGSNTATFTPSANLALGTTYTATVTTGIQDLAGNALPSDFVWTFTTEQESTPPEIITVTPEDGAEDIAVTSDITAEFSEAMAAGSINTSSFTVTQNGNPISGSVSYTGTTATFNPNNNFDFDATITATITTLATDLADNNLASNVSWSFTTEQESTAPAITSTNPINNAQDVQTNTSIAANFSEPMNPATINGTTFTVTQDGTPVAGNVSYSGTTAIFTPSTNLAFASTFTATVTTGAQDLVGNALASDFTWSFTTAQETTAPQVTNPSPANGESDVAVSRNITAGFSEPMDPATINSSTFTVTQDGTDVAGAINYSGTTATFNPTTNLAFGTAVTVTITTGATDLAGNALPSDFSWSFTTEQESTPPEISTTNPENNATDVPVVSAITATFNEAMAASTINTATFSLSQGGTPVAGSVSYDAGSNTATFTPSADLALGTSYTATVTTGAEDLVGNSLEDDFNWNFTTEEESVPPEVTSTDPIDGATNVSVDGAITATFSEPLNPATVNSSTFSVALDGSLVSGSVSYSGTTATFTPDADLPFGSTFTATITSGVQDLVGNALPGNEVWTFTTEQESTPPGVGDVNPQNNATDVPANATVSAIFNEAMNATTINTNTFSLSQGGTPVAGSVSYDAGSNTATFTPSADLALGTSYTATVTTGAQDLAGNALTSAVSWDFTTEQESVPPGITSVTPLEGTSGVPVTSNITATFNEAMDPATINETNFTVSQDGSPVTGTVSYSSNTATFTPSSDLAFDATVTATITTGAADVAGNNLPSNFNWSFTTEQESTPPEISTTNPENNATDVPVGNAITATFNEEMDASTINTATFSLSQGGTPVAGSVSYAAGSNTATFTPSANLAQGTSYTATVTTGAQDLAGNALAGDVVWTFTTEPAAGEEDGVVSSSGNTIN